MKNFFLGIVVALTTLPSIECKSQSMKFFSLDCVCHKLNADSLAKEYESTIGFEEIRTPIPCDCGNCLVLCVRIDTVRKEPTYHDFVAWLRNEFKGKRLK